jgi:hypothetical protein
VNTLGILRIDVWRARPVVDGRGEREGVREGVRGGVREGVRGGVRGIARVQRYFGGAREGSGLLDYLITSLHGKKKITEQKLFVGGLGFKFEGVRI